MVIWWRKTPQSVCWNTRSWYSNTNTHTFSHSEMIIQCIHYTRWRLAWGKQLLIASNSLQFVWDHLSSLLCFSVVALWKPIGWQLMYGLLQSPQPGPRDPATTLSPHLRSISSSFAPVLSYYFPGLFSASQCVFFFFFLDLGSVVRIFQGCSVNLLRVGVEVKEQVIVCIHVLKVGSQR